ncbi:hypothetical protein LDJ90_02600 [Fusobacterium vincentii]|uniref:hypothetical protein n=1 Tax=Fusobacterium vincentii TaxID=155615 RepID=UPI000C1C5D22|nr:hypothetical protein [Fusobacterium vincentii]ATV06039.1 hypothetical protein CS401_04170 [Fusobacterium vincentii]
MKNFTLEYTNNQWNLYTEDKTKVGAEVLKLFPELKDLAYLEDEYTSIVATWDSTEEQGYIDVEITAVHSDNTYPFNYKFNDFSKFVKALNNLENEIEIDKLNVNDWEYEKEDPYGSRGLSIRDFI